jgi:prepilin-type N-terminal cleavage/methylation domain-containing protein
VSRLRAALRARRPDDAGFSLIEVLVSMGIMSILMTIFTTAILQAYRVSGRAESISIAQSEIQRGFERFDRELRYASWVADPAMVGTSTWYVEFAGADGTECMQLRFRTAPASGPGEANGEGVLQLLRWTPGSPPTPGEPGQTVASQLLTPAAGVPPFDRQEANESPYQSQGSDFTTDFQRLRIRLTSRVDDAEATVDMTFTALNTSRSTTDAAQPCREGRPTS